MLPATILAQSPDSKISGRVTDKTGNPLPGVNVTVVGTYSGTSTDAEGRYTIQADAGQALEFSFVGMKSQIVPIENRTIIDVTLEEEVNMIGETVVIGYGTARKRDLTGSIANVAGDDIAGRPASNPLASLQGKVAGVQIINSGRAGQDPEIRIRGTNSINGYSPLYVVDGLFTDNINYLNPADIQSMEILKDPSSLAIFGVRGANGVIIITTKRARSGETLVNINTSMGFKHVGHRIDLTNGAQFQELYNEQLSNQNAAPFDYTYYNANTDWQDQIFRTGFITNTNISISGSTEKAKFYLGAGYLMEEGSIKSEKMNKVTINLSSDYTAKKWLRFGFQANGAYTLPADAKNVTSAVHAAPISPVYDRTTDSYYALPDFQRAQVANPMIDIKQVARHNKAQNYRLTGNIYGEADLMENLTFRATLSVDYASDNSRQFSPLLYAYYPELGQKQLTNTTESINQTKTNTLNAQQDYILTYNDSWGRHHLTALAGLTTNYTDYQTLGGGRNQDQDADLPIPNDPNKWWISSIGDEASATNSGSQYRRFTMSYLFRALYNYDNRYLVNASYRRDGASVFRNTGNTWDNFYSLGAGWVLSEEKFMRNQRVIDYLKIKGSFGVLGNQNTGSTGGRYPSYPTLNSTNAVFGDNIVSAYSQAYLVTNLGWEKTEAWETGFEMNLLDSRMRLEAVYYHKKTKDLIVYLEKFMGAQDGLINAGDILNKGFELSAGWSDRIGSDFRYAVTANLTTIQNRVTSLGNQGFRVTGGNGVAVTEKGFPIGYFYGYVVEGVYQNNEEIQQSPTNTLATVQPGDLKFKDIDHNGIINAEDRTKIGNPTPNFTYGCNLTLGYKNFDLSIDLQGVHGNEIYANGYQSDYAQFNYLKKRLGRWNGEGTSNWEPILDPARAVNQLNSSYFIEDGSYFRLRNIQLGYNFSERILQKLRLQGLRLFINIDNLKTWAHNSGYTPEIGGSAIAFGIDSGNTYPVPSTYTFGINVTF